MSIERLVCRLRDAGVKARFVCACVRSVLFVLLAVLVSLVIRAACGLAERAVDMLEGLRGDPRPVWYFGRGWRSPRQAVAGGALVTLWMLFALI